VPAPHALPIYWCHVMEGDESRELVPLPAEGFGCAFADDHALAKALLEACQARLTVISGAREDLTRQAYVQSPPRRHLAEWRHALARTNHLSRGRTYEESNGSPRLGLLLRALKAAGARAAIVVPLYCDDTIGVAVVRLVAPPLRPCSYERRP
jgi:ribosomal protein S12 methylthiotransferase accessory factor